MSNCLHQDTLIFTSDYQVKQVKDIAVGDSVLGADGNFYSVANIALYQDIDCMLFQDVIFSNDHFNSLSLDIKTTFKDCMFIKSDVIGFVGNSNNHIPTLPTKLLSYFLNNK